MQLGDRRHYRQSQPDAGRTAARIAAVKASRYFRLLLIWNSRTVVSNADADRALRERLNLDADRSALRRVFERVVDEVADGLSQQHGVARDLRRSLAVILQSDAFELRGGLIEIHRLPGDLGRVHRHKAGTPYAGIYFRQT